MVRRCSGEVLLMSLMVLAAAGEAAAQDCPQPVGHFGSGLVRAVATDGGRAYVGAGVVLQVVDLSTPAAPTLLGEVSLPDLVDDVAASGDHVYVADRLSGLRVVDVSNPAAPVEVGSLPLGPVVGVAVSGSHAFLAMLWGLWVVDVSTPSAPVVVGSLQGSARAVAVAGSHAYLATSDGLRVVDILDPAEPVEIGSCAAGFAYDVAVAGSSVYLVTQSKLKVVDVSDPASPFVAGELAFGNGTIAEAVAAAGPLALIAGGESGLHVVDASNPSAPVEIGALDTEGRAVDVAIAGSLALVGDDLGGLKLVDVSDPSTPAEIGAHEVLGWVSRIAAAGRYVYAGTWNGGVRVVDVANPSAPTEVGDIPISAEDLTVVGTLLYVATGDVDLRILEVAEPTAPVEVGSYNGPGATYGVALAGPHAYLVGSHGLRVVDVTNPAAPVEVGHCDSCGGSAITLSGSRAFVSASSAMTAVDITDPTAPVELGRYEIPSQWPWEICVAGEVAVVGAFAYVSCSSNSWDSYGQIHVLDISDPATPTSVAVIGECPAWWRGPALAPAGSVLYVGTVCGIRALDVSDPMATVEIGFHDAREVEETGTSDIALSGGHLYLADDTAGLDVMTGCHLFVDGFEIGTTATWGLPTP